jgi:hypothetical protein
MTKELLPGDYIEGCVTVWPWNYANKIANKDKKE